MSNRLTPLENASVGTVGGVLEVLALQPFNYAKNARQQGIPLTVNPRKLYRGVLPNMMNMGSCTMWQFVVCGAVARAMSGGADRKATPIEGVVSGLAAGVSSALLGGPLELLMIQQQVKGGALPGHLRNLAGPSLARGIVPAAAREGIWAFSFLSLPPIIRDQLTTRWPGAFSSADRARTGAALIGAGLSCLASQPFDTVKTNMQGDVERRRFTSMLQTFRALHASGGLSSFYRGVEWRYGRMVIAIWILDKVRVDLGRIMYPASKCCGLGCCVGECMTPFAVRRVPVTTREYAHRQGLAQRPASAVFGVRNLWLARRGLPPSSCRWLRCNACECTASCPVSPVRCAMLPSQPLTSVPLPPNLDRWHPDGQKRQQHPAATPPPGILPCRATTDAGVGRNGKGTRQVGRRWRCN